MSFYDTHRAFLRQEAFKVDADFRRGCYGSRFGTFDQYEQAKSRSEDSSSVTGSPILGSIEQQCENCQGTGCDPNSVVHYAEKCPECDGRGWTEPAPRKRPGSQPATKKKEQTA